MHHPLHKSAFVIVLIAAMSDAESDSDDSLHEFLALSRIIPMHDPKIAFLLQQTRKQFQLHRKQKKIVKTSIAERKRSETCKLSYHTPSLDENNVAVLSMYGKAQGTQIGNKPSLCKATKQSHANRKRLRQAIINNSWFVNDDYILTI